MKNLIIAVILLAFAACKLEKQEKAPDPIITEEEAYENKDAAFYCVDSGDGVLIQTQSLEKAKTNYENWLKDGRAASIFKCD